MPDGVGVESALFVELLLAAMLDKPVGDAQPLVAPDKARPWRDTAMLPVRKHPLL